MASQVGIQLQRAHRWMHQFYCGSVHLLQKWKELSSYQKDGEETTKTNNEQQANKQKWIYFGIITFIYQSTDFHVYLWAGIDSTTLLITIIALV